jgi:hypothetical protein
MSRRGEYAAKNGIPIKLWVGRSMFQAHLFQVDFELFGDQHRDGGIGPLPHLNIRHGQNDTPIALDADEGIRRKAFTVDRRSIAI